jgi:hypothetical protein
MIFRSGSSAVLCLLLSLLLYIGPWIHSSLSQTFRLDCLASIIQCSAYDKFFNEGVNCHVSSYFNIFLTKLFYKFSIIILKYIYIYIYIYILYVKISYFSFCVHMASLYCIFFLSVYVRLMHKPNF